MAPQMVTECLDNEKKPAAMLRAIILAANQFHL